MKHWKQNNPGHRALGVSRRADPQATGRTGRWSAGTSWCVLSCELLSPTVTQKEVMLKGSPLFFSSSVKCPTFLGPQGVVSFAAQLQPWKMFPVRPPQTLLLVVRQDGEKSW